MVMEQYAPTINKEELAPGVVVYKDVIPGHHQLVPYIEQMVEAGMASWDTVEILGNQVNGMSFPYPQQFKDPNDFSISFEERISLVTAGFLALVEQDFSMTNKLMHMKHDPIGLIKYGTGTAFPLNEYKPNSIFATLNDLVVLYFLNDDYSGSILEFPNLGISYQPKANEALIFPSAEGFEYSVSELTEGTKYVVTTYLKLG
jgi:hypothetical protein